MNPSFFQEVLAVIDKNVRFISFEPIHGGSINTTGKLIHDKGVFFIKWNNHPLDLFTKEKLGLQMLKSANAIKIPQVIGSGRVANQNFMVLEYIKTGNPSTSFWQDLGQGLSSLHRITDTHFGLDHSNYIGLLHQDNKFSSSWVDFFIEQRLIPQVRLCQDKGLLDNTLTTGFERLYAKLKDLLPCEKPSLLHGDLWSGNILCNQSSTPYLCDPAVYYGHREIELAFTRLFGGFDQKFYEAYNESLPLRPGFKSRIDLYNLYPLLVHANLFGASYLTGIIKTLKQYA